MRNSALHSFNHKLILNKSRISNSLLDLLAQLSLFDRLFLKYVPNIDAFIPKISPQALCNLLCKGSRGANDEDSHCVLFPKSVNQEIQWVFGSVDEELLHQVLEDFINVGKVGGV